jgi:hypothetical protein
MLSCTQMLLEIHTIITITLALWKNVFTKIGCSVEYAILIAVAS